MPLKIDHLTYKYHPGTPMEVLALDDISLELNEGEFVSIIGHTGSGKSTFIQHLNGLLKPSSGDILYNEKSIYSKDFSMLELRSHVGLVFQYPEHQLFKDTVIDDVCFGPKNLGLTDEEARERAEFALSQVSLYSDIYEKSPYELSGGQKRRAAIAGVLAMKPDFLVLDEPTAGLDPYGRDEILDKLSELKNEHGIGILLVSHSMDDAAKYADRIIVLDKGHVCFDAAPTEVFSYSNRERLTAIGLDVPQMSSLAMELRNEGLDIPANILTEDDLFSAIINLIGSETK